MAIGYRDGKLLLYDLGVYQASDAAGSAVRRVRSNHVYMGRERTDTVLPRMTGAGFIDVVSYNENRSLMFGYEQDSITFKKVYSIWDLESGRILQTFSASDFVSGADYDRFNMQINSAFTYAVAEYSTGMDQSRFYYVIDLASGDVLYTHAIPITCQSRRPGLTMIDRILYGMGCTPNLLWFFHEDILTLEIVDVSSGDVMDRISINERLRHNEHTLFYQLYGVPYIKSMVYDINNDLIVFIGSTDSIYSLSSGRMIFTGSITEVESDLSAIYVGPNFERVDFSPASLYERLRQFRHVGTMTEEDIRSTGLDIFD
jgi:hypothetical protein